MTLGHFAFAAYYTVYVLVALFIEERDLVGAHGPAYREYQRRVPKLFPVRLRPAAPAADAPAEAS